MTEKLLLWNDIYVGQEFPELNHFISVETINKYAEAVEDFNPIFIDPKHAEKKGFGGQIAHPTTAGIYILQAYKTAGGIPPGGIHAKQKFKFIAPVMSGEKLVTKARVIDKYLKRDMKFVEVETVTTGEGGQDKVYSVLTLIWAQ